MLVVLFAEGDAVDVQQVVGVAERGAVLGGLGVLGGAGAPVDTFGEVALPVLDPRRGELQLDAALEAITAAERSSAVEASPVPGECLGVVPEALADDALLAHQPRPRKCVLMQATGAPVRFLRLLVARRQLADVAEGLGDARNLVRRQLEVVGGGERTLVELGRDDVRRPALGQLSDGNGVAPGLLVVLGLEEVERELRCELDRSRTGAPLEHRGQAAVDLASATEREPLVGNRPEEVVPEPQRVRSLPGHELAEPAPAVEVADVLELVRKHVRQQVELELGAEHGRVPQQEAIARLERVDPRRDQGLDGLRQARDAAA